MKERPALGRRIWGWVLGIVMVVSSCFAALSARGPSLFAFMGAALAAMSLTFAPIDTAQAAGSPLPCVDVNLAGDASGFSSACQVLQGVSNDQPKTEVAEQGAFGIYDWVFAGKDEFGSSETSIETGFSLDRGSDGQGGVWSIDPIVWDSFPSVLVLFKSAGSKQAEKVGSLGNVVMFLIQPGLSSGEYASSLGKYDVSHVSLYLSQTDPFGSGTSLRESANVPLPAPAWMLIAGLGALGGLRRLRRSRA